MLAYVASNPMTFVDPLGLLTDNPQIRELARLMRIYQLWSRAGNLTEEEKRELRRLIVGMLIDLGLYQGPYPGGDGGMAQMLRDLEQGIGEEIGINESAIDAANNEEGGRAGDAVSDLIDAGTGFGDGLIPFLGPAARALSDGLFGTNLDEGFDSDNGWYVGGAIAGGVTTAAATAGLGAASASAPAYPAVPNLGRVVAGGRLTGFTRHGLNQAIGRDGGIGVASRAILNTVKNPTSVTYQQSVQGVKRVLTSDAATVVLNVRGQVVSTWARSSSGVRGVVP